MIRMVNSGTEATMSAVKLARGYTKKDKIIKFAGCYHGHFDGFLIEAGSGVLTEGIPGCLGVPEESIKNTLIGIYNDEKQVEELFEKYGNDIAGIIIEPVAGNMGVVKCDPKFMRKLRELCDKYGALLIFDEVMCGFRVAYKGAQTLFDVKPDLVTYAKNNGWWTTLWSIWWKKRDNGKLITTRWSLSSWNNVRKPNSNECRTCNS